MLSKQTREIQYLNNQLDFQVQIKVWNSENKSYADQYHDISIIDIDIMVNFVILLSIR